MEAFFPMRYQNFYNADLQWIGDYLVEQIARLKKDVPIYSGLFLPALSGNQFGVTIKISLDSGVSGVTLFSFHQLSDYHWEKVIQF